jgi:hypothetical protein
MQSRPQQKICSKHHTSYYEIKGTSERKMKKYEFSKPVLSFWQHMQPVIYDYGCFVILYQTNTEVCVWNFFFIYFCSSPKRLCHVSPGTWKTCDTQTQHSSRELMTELLDNDKWLPVLWFQQYSLSDRRCWLTSTA